MTNLAYQYNLNDNSTGIDCGARIPLPVSRNIASAKKRAKNFAGNSLFLARRLPTTTQNINGRLPQRH